PPCDMLRMKRPSLAVKFSVQPRRVAFNSQGPVLNPSPILVRRQDYNQSPSAVNRRFARQAHSTVPFVPDTFVFPSWVYTTRCHHHLCQQVRPVYVAVFPHVLGAFPLPTGYCRQRKCLEPSDSMPLLLIAYMST